MYCADSDYLSQPPIISGELGDKEIRFWLKIHLSRRVPKPQSIIEELRVHKGNAIADVVTLHKFAHCYEIKSDKDNIEKAIQQALYFDLVFKKSSIVTTQRHLRKAENLLPQHWGIIVAHDHGREIRFRYERAANPSPSYNKQLALLTLWKPELCTLASKIKEGKFEKMNRAALTVFISENLPCRTLSQEISSSLSKRSFKGQIL